LCIDPVSTHTQHRLRSGLLLFLLLALSTRAEARPEPQWVTCEPAGTAPLSPSIALETEFVTRPGLLRAIVLVAGDGSLPVQINHQAAGSSTSPNPATSLDVTRLLRTGTNRITLLPANATNRAAALLEMVYNQGHLEWVVTDASWKVLPGDGGLHPVSRGPATGDGKENPFDPRKAINAYDSWQLALKPGSATPAGSITVPPGFEVELLRSALPEEGSWVALAFDPRGRLTLAREKKGLLRATLDKGRIAGMEVINDTLLECRGLLYAHGALYANANNSKSFVRLRDTRGTGTFDEIQELLHTDGGVGHGRNHVVEGPDGSLYLVHGNNVIPPTSISPTSPHRRYVNDRLIPCPWDDRQFDGDVLLPAGHILRTDPQGSRFELVAGGFRNPLDAAFHKNGDLFTFDADMEWDVGLPWYRPNRVNLVVSGGEYGWRRGTAKWPDYYPDVVPSVLDIGLASPTAVKFGYKTSFPPRYRDALYICDWSYGRILAVHLRPQWSGYVAESEPFVLGRPLNVTDLVPGPDGAFYFTTGGRGTQSGLYRVRWTGVGAGPDAAQPWVFHSGTESAEQQSPRAHETRRRLEALHTRPEGDKDPAALEAIWAELASRDRAIRYAARIALERQDPATWVGRALKEPESARFANAALALARVAPANELASVLRRILDFIPTQPARAATDADRVILPLLRAATISLARLTNSLPHAQRTDVRTAMESIYPTPVRAANHLLCELLVYLESPAVLPRTLELLEASSASEDLVHYLFHLRLVKQGWTPEARLRWFRSLGRAARLSGGNYYQPELAQLKQEMLQRAPEVERALLANAAEVRRTPGATSPPGGAAPARAFVKEWTLGDLAASVAEAGKGSKPDASRGKRLFGEAQCATCHRMGEDYPEGDVGPDLTGVGARFGPRDLLESVVDPSKVVDEKYRQTEFTLADGSTVAGIIVLEDAQKVVVKAALAHAGEPVVLEKASIQSRRTATLSPMPEGLMNSLQPGEVADLLAYLSRGPETKPHLP
jgi:hypothetical protein